MPLSIPAVEFGFMLCRSPNGALTRGPVGVGTATAVQFSDQCPAGTTVAGSVHSHPQEGGGSILPSGQDMGESGRLNMPALCIVNNTKVACYGVKGVAGAQVPTLMLARGAGAFAQLFRALR